VIPREFQARLAASLLAVTLGWALPAGAQDARPRAASSYATALGAPLRTIIVFGDQYNGGDELYDVTITVAEVLRGEKAWRMVRAAGDANPPAPASQEYLLARVRFEFAARAEPHHYNYTVDPAQFSPMSANTDVYAAPALAAPLKPELRGVLRPGDSAEGWLAFIVPRSDHTPLLMFRADVGSVIHQGDASFFKLYGEHSGEQPAPKKP